MESYIFFFFLIVFYKHGCFYSMSSVFGSVFVYSSVLESWVPRPLQGLCSTSSASHHQSSRLNRPDIRAVCVCVCVTQVPRDGGAGM